jgi:hypothetical protein
MGGSDALLGKLGMSVRGNTVLHVLLLWSSGGPVMDTIGWILLILWVGAIAYGGWYGYKNMP